MSFSSKVQTALVTFRRDGASEVTRRLRKSVRMRWHRRRGRTLNYKKSWRTKQPVLVIESDDWGAEHIPGPNALREIQEAGFLFEASYHDYDGLETPEDVDRLCELLSNYRDGNGNPAVLTANFIMANPDFTAIKETEYTVFKAKTIDRGWNNEPDSNALWHSYRKGIKEGVFVPQLHGIRHFNPEQWLEKLRCGDSATLKAFSLQTIGENEYPSEIGTESMGPIYHGNDQAIQELVSEGIETFSTCFNMDSFTTIAPCYGWRSPETEEALLSHGVQAMQGGVSQYLPNGKVKLHYLGEHGPAGMLYMVRTCRLEPISAGTSVEECFAQICDAFARNIPAVLGSHRINYTSRVDVRIRDKGLAVLDGVLKRVIQAYRNVEFLSSDKLALHILQES